MKQRILQVVLDMQYVGEKIVATLAKGLSHEFDFFFCCLDKVGLLGEDLRKDGFYVEALNRTPGFDYKLPFKIAQLAKKENINIIQAHHYTPYFYSALSRFINSRPHLIFTEHGREFPDIVNLKRRVANIALNLVTHKITSVCEYSKKGLIQKDGFPASKIHVIYNGIDTVKQENLSPDPSNTAIQEWIGASDQILGFLARLEWIKHPELLIEAFALAVKKAPEAKLVIMGKGELMTALKKQCKNLGINNKVLFTGLLKNPLPIVAKLRALVVTSRSEAASLSILEAMMCGVPVIASQVGGNEELIEDGKTGLIVPSGDTQGYADAMLKVLLDRNLSRRLGQTAKVEAQKRFTVSTMIESFRNLYHEII